MTISGRPDVRQLRPSLPRTVPRSLGPRNYQLFSPIRLSLWPSRPPYRLIWVPTNARTGLTVGANTGITLAKAAERSNHPKTNYPQIDDNSSLDPVDKSCENHFFTIGVTLLHSCLLVASAYQSAGRLRACGRFWLVPGGRGWPVAGCLAVLVVAAGAV